MDYKCDCCGAQATFETIEEAFESGWDVPPKNRKTTCHLCPSFYINSGLTWRHAMIHEEWEIIGRPEQFDQETCLLPEDRFAPEAVVALAEKIGGDPRFEKRLVNSMIMAVRKEQESSLRKLNRWAEYANIEAW